MKRIEVEDGVKESLTEAMKLADRSRRLEAKANARPFPEPCTETYVIDAALALFRSTCNDRISEIADQLIGDTP